MKTFVLILLFATCASAQDFKIMPWKVDRWNSTDGIILKSDKLEHVIRDGALFYASRKVGFSAKTSFILVTSAAVAWEVRDGFKWRETDGFSTKDLIAGFGGQLITHLITSKIFKQKR